MTTAVQRLESAAGKLLRRKIIAITRDEWETTMHPSGRPTKLAAPLSRFHAINQKVKVVVSASSSPRQGTPGFHIVREDPADAPKIYNLDSYDAIDLRAQPEWPRIRSSARLTESEGDEITRSHVFLTPVKRSDHHSSTVPPDIDGAKPR
jgi:hypothetical protein